MNIDFEKVVPKFDEAVARGFCEGVGNQAGQMCVEASICYALGLPHSDDPECVSRAVRRFKIAINDCNWSSTNARARALRNIGIAQLGSNGVVDDSQFFIMVSERIIKVLIPRLYRQVFPSSKKLLALADRCEKEGTSAAARAAAASAADAYASYAAASAAASAASYASYAAAAAASYASYADADAYTAAAYASYAAASAASTRTGDEFLILATNIALDVLVELKSPGVEWLKKEGSI